MMNNITLEETEVKKGIKIQSKILEKIKQLGLTALPDKPSISIDFETVDNERTSPENSFVSTSIVNTVVKSLQTCNSKTIPFSQSLSPFKPSNLIEILSGSKLSQFKNDPSKKESVIKQTNSLTKNPNGNEIIFSQLTSWKVSDFLEMVGQDSNNLLETDNPGITRTFESINAICNDETFVITTINTPNSYTNTPKSFTSTISVKITQNKMGECLRIAKMAALWLEIYPNGKILLEFKRNTVDLSLLLASCVLSATKSHRSAEIALKYLIKLNKAWQETKNLAIAQRYTEYFDSLYGKKEERALSCVNLHQVILYTPTLIHNRAASLVLEAFDESGKKYKCHQSYSDNSFTIYSNLKWDLHGETQIRITERSTKTDRAFTKTDCDPSQLLLPINSKFYRQGVFRFYIGDIIHDGRTESLVGKEFFIDLIFVETKDSTKTSMLTDLKKEEEDKNSINILLSAINRDENKRISGILTKKGYSKNTAILCSKLTSDTTKALEIAKRLSKYQRMEVTVEKRVEPVTQTIKPLSTIYKHSELIKAKPIEEITEIDGNELPVTKPKQIRSFLRRKHATIPKHMEGTPASRPLHWSVITNVESTIFSEMESISVNINRREFELTFCNPIGSETGSKKKESVNQSVLQNPRRIFLVSLALRHLERKGVAYNKISEIINYSPERLTLQDLINAEQIFPDSKERTLLESVPIESLTQTERAMLYVSNDKFAAVAVRILIFERKSREEFQIIHRFLDRMAEATNLVMTNDRLKFVLKVVLELGNMINCSLRKPYAAGFRLESLRLVSSYRGPKGKSLKTFLIEVLYRSNIDISVLFSEFQVLKELPAENLEKIKEKINLQIKQYNEVLKIAEEMPGTESKKYSGFINHAMMELCDLSKKYRECFVLSCVLRLKFGEENAMPAATIFQILKEFLDGLKEESMKTTT